MPFYTAWFNKKISSSVAALICIIGLLLSTSLTVGKTEQGFAALQSGVFAMQLQASFLAEAIKSSF